MIDASLWVYRGAATMAFCYLSVTTLVFSVYIGLVDGAVTASVVLAFIAAALALFGLIVLPE